VEDDEIIARTIKSYIESWGCEVMCVTDFSSVLEQFVSFSPHLILMDLYLPFFNGYYWCTEIRKLSDVPIVFISSASDNMNIVMAINMGGDDFITKPFDLNVLTAKVQALLRRTYRGQRIDLTKNEYKILHILMENRGKTVSREVIMSRLWETDSFIDDNTLTVNITRLRKKLEDSGLCDFIATKKGIGYMVK
jgi:DNA-binding response OmpR family regulator